MEVNRLVRGRRARGHNVSDTSRLGQGHAHLREHLSSDTIVDLHEAEEHVLRPDEGLLKESSLLLGDNEHVSRPISKAFEHGQKRDRSDDRKPRGDSDPTLAIRRESSIRAR